MANKDTLDFTMAQADKELNDYFVLKIEEDFKTITIPKDIKELLARLMKLRETELRPDMLDKMQAPRFITLQGEVMNYKYLIARHLSVLKGAQSYAFIFRKFLGAHEYNVAKERLGKDAKKVTVGEIDSEVEKKIVTARKSEVAFQVACDRIELLLDWCDDVIMNIQNRIRQENTNAKTQYADQPGRG